MFESLFDTIMYFIISISITTIISLKVEHLLRLTIKYIQLSRKLKMLSQTSSASLGLINQHNETKSIR